MLNSAFRIPSTAVSNWIAACDRMLGMVMESVVPGHGPITDKRGVAAVGDYLRYIREARLRYDAGMDLYEAAQDISLSDYDSWADAERIVANIATLCREFDHDTSPPDIAANFALMAQLHYQRRG